MPVSVPVQNLAYAAQQSGSTLVNQPGSVGGSVVLLQPNSQAQASTSHSPNGKTTINSDQNKC